MMSLMRSTRSMIKFSLKNGKRYYELRCVLSSLGTKCLFHTEQCTFKENNTKKELTLMKYVFERTDEKKKDAFLEIIRIHKKEKHNQRHLAFIKIALKYMEVYGVHRDLEVYKAIVDILPKGPFVARNYYQALLQYHPHHQNTITELLEQMENNRVMPDKELEVMLLNTFGKHANVLKKLWRMMYWMPKFANLNPWPVPKPVPKDPKILARIAINKISSADVTSITSEFETVEVEKDEELIEDTWVISAISPIQKDLLVQHAKFKIDEAIYVEGPFKVWVADQSVDYFVLKGNPVERPEINKNIDDVSNLKIPFWKTQEVIVEPTVHEQEDGLYFAVSATGTSSKDSMVSWIRCLQKDNPVLKDIPILIKLASSIGTECISFKDAEKSLLKKKNCLKNTTNEK